MTTRPQSATERSVHADVPAPKHHAWAEENLGAAIGVVAGGAAGAIAGPIGIVIGASAGAIIGDAAGDALYGRAVEGAKPDPEIVGAADHWATLRADHVLLESLAHGILRTIVEGEREDVAGALQELQKAVLTHLEGEERELIPTYAQYAPEDAALILKDHASIRCTLADLDVATDLHLVRADAVATFIGTLQAHAAREDAGLYRPPARPAP